MYSIRIYTVRVWIIDFIIRILPLLLLPITIIGSVEWLITVGAIDAKMLVIGSGGLQCWRGCLAIR